MAKVADDLADAVSQQWEKEAALRLVKDYSLPVRWRPMDPSLLEDWSSLVERLVTGVGWPPSPAGMGAAGPEDLAGSGNDLASVLGRVPTGRLVVLGEPGAGKTILLVRLVLGLLACRSKGGPVPILIPLASWNPETEELYDWLERRLAIDYPGLSEPGPTARTSRARCLLDEGLIVLVLDGLDEIPDGLRGRAIARINDALPTRQPLVIASRSVPFRAAVRPPPGGIEVQLAGASGVELCALDMGAVTNYLRESAGGPAAAARWKPVFKALLGNSSLPVAQALRTPLMASLARIVYNPRPGEVLSAIPRHPAELLDSTMFATKDEVEEHLFDAFIHAAYRPYEEESRRRRRWTAAQAEQSLIFLARDLQNRRTTDLNWWEIHSAAPQSLAGLSVGLIAGLAGAFGLVNGVGVGVALIAAVTVVLVVRRWNRPAGLARGLIGGLIVRRWNRPAGLAQGLIGGLIGGAAGALAGHAVIGASLGPMLAGGLTYGLAIGYLGGFGAGLAGGFAGGFVGALVGHPDLGYVERLINGLGLGLAAGCIVGLTQRRRPARELRWSPIGLVLALGAGLAIGFAVWLQAGLVGALIAGLFSIAGVGFAAGLEAASAEAAEAADPSAVAARDRTTFWKTGLAAGLAIGLSAGFSAGFPLGFKPGIDVGVASAVAAALAVGFRQASWGQFTVARWWLAIRGRLPWHLMDFLADAHKRGVLRQIGATYQFSHKKLQDRLASRP